VSQLASIAWLGWRFVVVQPLRKALQRVSARDRFAAAWFGEGLVPVLDEERELSLAAAACTGCGLCELQCTLSARSRGTGAMGLQSVFRLHSKHPGEVALAAPLLEGCIGCRGCDDTCPSGVPISWIVTHLRARATAAARRRSAGEGA